MHIRVLAGYLNRDAGNNVYNISLANSLHERGHRVSMVAFNGSGLLSPGVSLTILPLHRFAQTKLWRLTYPLHIIFGTYDLWRAPLEAPDVCISAEHFFVAGHYAKFPKTPWIYLPHSRLIEEFVPTQYTGLARRVAQPTAVALQRWALRHATTTMRFHESSREVMIDRYGLRADHPFFINPQGVALPPPEVMEYRPWHRDTLRLLTVSALREAKNHALALQALARCSEVPGWHYDIVGDGPERGNLETVVQALKLGNRVTFHGARNDVGRFYSEADVFLFPSRADNAPLVVLEAMSFGVPVVALDDEAEGVALCNRAFIAPRRNGILASSEADFMAVVADILQRKIDIEGLSRAARHSVENSFTWDAHVDRMVEKLMELVGRGTLVAG